MKKLREEILFLLSTEGRVDMPKAGVLKCVRVSARWDDNKGIFSPPCNSLTFRPSHSDDASLSLYPLASLHSRLSGISLPDAVRETEKDIADFLSGEKPMDLGEWGVLFPPSGKEGSSEGCKFVASKYHPTMPELYALPVITFEGMRTVTPVQPATADKERTETAEKPALVAASAIPGPQPAQEEPHDRGEDDGDAEEVVTSGHNRSIRGFWSVAAAIAAAIIFAVFILPPRTMYGIYQHQSDEDNKAYSDHKTVVDIYGAGKSASAKASKPGNGATEKALAGVWGIPAAAKDMVRKASDHTGSATMSEQATAASNDGKRKSQEVVTPGAWTIVVAGHVSVEGAKNLKRQLLSMQKDYPVLQAIQVERSKGHNRVTVGQYRTKADALTALQKVRTIEVDGLSDSWVTVNTASAKGNAGTKS